MSWNVRGLQNFFNHQQHMNIDIYCICETWASSEITLLGDWDKFTIVTSPAVKEKCMGHACGGIAIIARRGLEIKVINSSDSWLFVSVSAGLSFFVLACVYIRPSRNMAASLDILQQTLDEINETTVYPPIILTGDFNAHVGNLDDISEDLIIGTNLTEFRTSIDTKVDTRGHKLYSFLQNNSMHFTNGRTISDSPGKITHIGKGCSTIDYVITNVQAFEQIVNLEVLQYENDSDHFPLLLQTYLSNTFKRDISSDNYDEPGRVIYTWQQDKKEDFKLHMRNSHRICVDFSAMSTTDLSHNLQEVMKSTANLIGLTREIKSKRYKKKTQPWYDTDCKIVKNNLKLLFKQFKNNNFQSNAKKQSLDAKKSYKALRAVRRFKNKSTPNNNPIDINIWENFYAEHTVPKDQDQYTFFGTFDPSLDMKFTMEELNVAIKCSKPNKSPGPDCIKNEYYKSLSQNWKLYILCMFNKVLETEMIPDDWFTSTVTLLHKKGCKLDPANYRGIALINHCSKLFTSMLNRRLEIWAESNKVIPETQAVWIQTIEQRAGLITRRSRVRTQRTPGIFHQLK
ncbi:Similar to X-element\ORF2: Probable RNA-directed DNA polymerase from transposon X-element (Drosophila melanogaster) [Cotesia congregata]|uniref:Similar to X-element\ORF2: Probable RNA-directed DNA polymerase from transposon X-element (Drosophila melanogaster) n=1 Tax=Cotesia congregata TaxID=51543 RepID=A0A8J2E4T1_COTCN|nr:Similar to X-element\ORF2: Probable RNA-directed DNA polymerase from transposon X-element (Drosophila melanogaster) [Cotesia congregata]